MTPGVLQLMARVDSYHEIGYAHAVRAAALLKALPFEFRLSVAGHGQALADAFPGATRIELPRHDEDGSAFIDALKRCDANLVLVDHPRLDDTFWRRLRAHSAVVALDDEGGSVQADLIVNGTVLERYHHYPLLPPGARALLGPRYALLRPDFAAHPWRDPVSPTVTIVVGGGARAREWAHRLVDSLDVAAALTLVVGSSHPDRDALKARCSQRGMGFACGLSGADLAARLAASSVALTTGGMIVYECLAAGVPAVVFPQEPNLPPEAAWFAARGAVVDLGIDAGAEPAHASAAVNSLLADAARRRDMSQAQHALVDGHGLSRAAAAVAQLAGAAP